MNLKLSLVFSSFSFLTLVFCQVVAADLVIAGNTGSLSINTSTFSDPISWSGLTISDGDVLGFNFTVDDAIADTNANSTVGSYIGAIKSAEFFVGTQSAFLDSFSTNQIEVTASTNRDSLLFFFGNGGSNLQLDFSVASTLTTGPFLSDQLLPLGGVGADQFVDSNFTTSRSLLSLPGGTAAFSLNSENATITAVPEPSSLLLAGTACIVAFARRRTRIVGAHNGG